MKRLFRSTICWCFLSLLTPTAFAAFTSLYVFGDGVCTTTNTHDSTLTNSFYGGRYSNGRVWVEVLAERQGLTYDSNKNWSFFGHESQVLITNVAAWVAPVDAATALVVVWANDADFVTFINYLNPYTTNNLAAWTNAMNQSLANHYSAIQTLYNKGVRSLVMPNAADLTKVPFFVQLPAADKAFIRQRTVDYNLAFAALLNQARVAFPNVVIHSPDIFALLDDIVARASYYGLTNKLSGGFSIDALSDPVLVDKSLNGPGRDYIFWEYLDPTAKVHAILADVVQNLISPPRISHGTALGSSNELQLVNLPLGLSGFVDGTTNFVNWTPVIAFASTNATQSVLTPATYPQWFHRLRFPFAWSWP